MTQIFPDPIQEKQAKLEALKERERLAFTNGLIPSTSLLSSLIDSEALAINATLARNHIGEALELLEELGKAGKVGKVPTETTEHVLYHVVEELLNAQELLSSPPTP